MILSTREKVDGKLLYIFEILFNSFLFVDIIILVLILYRESSKKNWGVEIKMGFRDNVQQEQLFSAVA